MREIHKRYRDPLDEIWITTARRIGFVVERSRDCFASMQDGRLIIGAAETLDADDCLAQMIFHELCHSMVQGPGGLAQPDWGLQNVAPDQRDETREHAALRLQARLADDHALRGVLAPTTSFRRFYDSLPDDPFCGGDDAESIRLAEAAFARRDDGPWAPHVSAALHATATIVAVVGGFAGADALLRIDSPAKPQNAKRATDNVE